MIFSFSCRLTLNSCSIRILLAFFGQRQINKVLAAFKAANELLKRGMTIFRAKNSGTILPADSNIANELANSWALDVFPLYSLPDDAVMMKKRRIAVHGDAGVAAGFRENGYGCVLGAIWFSSEDGAAVSARMAADENRLVAGYWPDWQTSGADGKPVILNKDSDAQDTVLIDIDATFRGHPKNAFRLVGNAIFGGLD